MQEAVGLFEYVLSLLEQVQLEIFVERENFSLKLNSLDQGEQSRRVQESRYRINNWDIVKGSLSTSIDDQNFFNRVRGTYNRLPALGQNVRRTDFLSNEDSIAKSDLEISRELVFPNLYQSSIVQSQLRKVLSRASSAIRLIDCELTWQSLLLDLGDVIKVNIKVQNVVLEDMACVVRKVGYDPNGLKIPVNFWSNIL